MGGDWKPLSSIPCWVSNCVVVMTLPCLTQPMALDWMLTLLNMPIRVQYIQLKEDFLHFYSDVFLIATLPQIISSSMVFSPGVLRDHGRSQFIPRILCAAWCLRGFSGRTCERREAVEKDVLGLREAENDHLAEAYWSVVASFSFWNYIKQTYDVYFRVMPPCHLMAPHVDSEYGEAASERFLWTDQCVSRPTVWSLEIYCAGSHSWAIEHLAGERCDGWCGRTINHAYCIIKVTFFC